VIQLFIMIPDLGLKMNLLKPALVVVTGGMSYFGLLRLNVAIPHLVPSWSLVRVDPLLVCMIAALWANHVSPQRDSFREILHDLAPLVMPPFFTVAGATLDLQTIRRHIIAVPVLFSIRFIALALGSLLASLMVGHTPIVRNHLWMTLQSQSGVTLGLVAQMQLGLVGRQPWAKGTAAIITGCVVLNQLMGPTLCRFGIRNSGEAQSEDRAEISATDLDPEMLSQNHIPLPSPTCRISPLPSPSARTQRVSSCPRTPSSLTQMHGLLLESEASRTQRATSMVLPNLEDELSLDLEEELAADISHHNDEKGFDKFGYGLIRRAVGGA